MSRFLGLLATAAAIAGLVVTPSAGAAPAAPTAPAVLPPGGTFVPVTPTRVVDTRTSGGPVTQVAVPVGRAITVPDTSIAAVLLNITVVDADGAGYVYAAQFQNTSTSSGNFVARAPSATLALARTSLYYGLNVFTSAKANIVVDVQGYVTTAAAATADTFTPVSPRRIADTRRGLGGLHPFATGERQDLDVRGLGLLPDDATAVIANVTVASAAATTYLTAWSGTGDRPTVSTVNAGKGEIVANRVLLPLSGAGFAALFNNNGRTDIVVDVVGYVSPSSTGSYYLPITPTRLTDTAAAQDVGVDVTIGAHPTDELRAPTVDDLLPTTAAWVTVVGDHPAGRGYVTARPSGTPAASTSDLNTVPGRAVANAGPVKVGADGGIEVTASSPTRVVVDLAGWFQTVPAAAPAAGIWAASEYPDYDTTPQVVSTLPSALPAAFAHAVAGASTFNATESVAFAVQDGQVLQSTDYSVRPGAGPVAGQGWHAPVRVGTLTGVTALATAGDRSYAATYALLGDGSVQAFGANDVGQLGRTPTPVQFLPLSPTPVTLARPATLVAAASKVGYAVLDDHSVVSWGRATYGQLGRPAGDEPYRPATVPGLTAPKAIAGDNYLTYAIAADGSTLTWGQPLGAGLAAQSSPVPVTGACATATSLHVDPTGAWEICSDGTVVQLDAGGVPVAVDHGVLAGRVVAGLTGVTQLGAAPGHLRALLADGTVAVTPIRQTSSTVPVLQARFRGVTAIGGTYGSQLTTVGGA